MNLIRFETLVNPGFINSHKWQFKKVSLQKMHHQTAAELNNTDINDVNIKKYATFFKANGYRDIVVCPGLDETFLRELEPHLMNRYAVFPWGACNHIVRVKAKSFINFPEQDDEWNTDFGEWRFNPTLDGHSSSGLRNTRTSSFKGDIFYTEIVSFFTPKLLLFYTKMFAFFTPFFYFKIFAFFTPTLSFFTPIFEF